MSLRTDLSRVRGLGAAGHGSEHWWRQRVSAVALIPLSVWFVISLMCKITAEHADVLDWIGKPHVTVLLIATVIAMFYHLKLGVQVVVEDYIHHTPTKVAALIALTLAATLGA